jgi:hypothetical protein
MWGNEHDLEDGKAKDTNVDDFFNATVVLVLLLRSRFPLAVSHCWSPRQGRRRWLLSSS